MDVREKLVELIKEISYDEEVRWYDLWDMREGAEDIADLLIAHGVTVQERISVDDRLPEESGNYIGCCDDSSCSYGEGIWYSSDVVVVSEYYEGSWIWYEGGTEWSLENIVTHWMPLPSTEGLK